MTLEPFAYAIQAPIGSVVPLFHRRKDAEDYIAKLTDSRDEAKIIPLYRKTVNSERTLDIMSDMPRWHTLSLIEQLRDAGSAMKCVPLFAVTAMRAAADEIEKLREAIRRLADQDATMSVVGGSVIVEMDATPEILEQLSQRGGYSLVPFDPPQPTLTDAEREAIQFMLRHAAQAASNDLFPDSADYIPHHKVIFAMMERLGSAQ